MKILGSSCLGKEIAFYQKMGGSIGVDTIKRFQVGLKEVLKLFQKMTVWRLDERFFVQIFDCSIAGGFNHILFSSRVFWLVVGNH